MRSFIHMIWSFVLLVSRAVKWFWLAVSRGRTVRLPENKGVDSPVQVAVALPPSAESIAPIQSQPPATLLASSNAWFEAVGFLSFNRAKRTRMRRVTLHFSESTYPADFSGLVVNAYFSVRAAGQPESVRFVVDPEGEIETTPQRRCHTLPLKVAPGADAEEAARIKETCEGTLLYPANVRHIELTFDGKKRQFVDSGSGRFYPHRLPRPAAILASAQRA